MLRKILIGVCVIGSLSGCEAPVVMAAKANKGEMTGLTSITFPAVMIVQYEGRKKEEVLRGKLTGYINGSAKYVLIGSTWGKCTGEHSIDGISTLKCGGKFDISTQTGKSKAKMSDVNVFADGKGDMALVAAIGWGNDATEAAVREAIRRYVSKHG